MFCFCSLFLYFIAYSRENYIHSHFLIMMITFGWCVCVCMCDVPVSIFFIQKMRNVVIGVRIFSQVYSLWRSYEWRIYVRSVTKICKLVFVMLSTRCLFVLTLWKWLEKQHSCTNLKHTKLMDVGFQCETNKYNFCTKAKHICFSAPFFLHIKI